MSERTLQESTAAADPARVKHYVDLFVVTTGLLSAFLLAVVLLGFLRRRRAGRGAVEAARAAAADAALRGGRGDAWAESARRLEDPGGPREPGS